MLKNYFKIVIRNISKNKLHSVINMLGLSVGISCCVLIFLFVQHELSFDKQHNKIDHIYRLTEILHKPKETNARALTSPPMAPALKAQFPEVEKTVRINYSARELSVNQKKFSDTRIIYADSTFFDIFTFDLIEGDARKSLVNPYSIVITKTAAQKYFGTEAVMGKVMQLSDSINLTVTGIMEDVPENSHFLFDCILSRTTITKMSNDRPENNWFGNGYYTYMLLDKNADPATLETKFTAFVKEQMAEETKANGLWYDLKLQPLKDIHLKSHLNGEINPNSDVMYVYIFSVAAILILLIACSNFINLSTAKSIERSKEIGIRKVMGARRPQLIFQFLGESFLMVFVSAALSVAFVAMALPFLGSLIGAPLSSFSFSNKELVLLYAGIIVVVSLLAGLYPAFLLSSFLPVKIIKGNIKYGSGDIVFRKGLVVFQFTIAIALMVSTALVFQQLSYMQSKNIGLQKEQVIEIPLGQATQQQAQLLSKSFLRNPGVLSSSLTSFSFKDQLSSIAMLPEGAREDEVTSEFMIAADEYFLNTFGIELAAGRNFSASFPTDPNEAFIVNEAAVKSFHWGSAETAIGKSINWNGEKKGKVVGVVKDFNYMSLHESVRPLIIHIIPDMNGYIAVRAKPEEMQQTLSSLKKEWDNTIRTIPFEYSFADQDFAALYVAENNMQYILSLFTVLSIFVACLGLFGLASIAIRQRMKEIGIRKVLGSSMSAIVGLLSKDFVKLVIVAVVIATPLVWIGVSRWLQDFAYRINIPIWIFALAGIGAIAVAFITISLQAVRAANVNPVKTLRSE